MWCLLTACQTHSRSNTRSSCQCTSTFRYVTGLRDPRCTAFEEWWILYPEQNRVFIQNCLLLLDEIQGEFDPFNPYAHIPSREILAENGEPVSEWEVGVDDLATKELGRIVTAARPACMQIAQERGQLRAAWGTRLGFGEGADTDELHDRPFRQSGSGGNGAKALPLGVQGHKPTQGSAFTANTEYSEI
jgi:CdiI N-terminal domain